MVNKIINYFNKLKYSKVINAIPKGENVVINFPIHVSNLKNLKIHNHVYIGPDAYFSTHGLIEIHSGTISGPRLRIYTGNHNYDSELMIPYDNITFVKPVIIEENVWLGGDVIILPGVRIGEGAVIAGGSVVVKDIPKYAIAGGNPAKVLKSRNIENYERLKAEGKVYLKIKKEHGLKMEYRIEEQ